MPHLALFQEENQTDINERLIAKYWECEGGGDGGLGWFDAYFWPACRFQNRYSKAQLEKTYTRNGA